MTWWGWLLTWAVGCGGFLVGAAWAGRKVARLERALRIEQEAFAAKSELAELYRSRIVQNWQGHVQLFRDVIQQ